MQRLLVSVQGKNEALEAIEGGAKIVDAENPDSALGKVYPLNIASIKGVAVRHRGVAVSTNIGEKQLNRRTACQSALGVATAGADIVKVGMASLDEGRVKLLTDRVTRTVKYWYPRKRIVPAFFADTALRRIFEPIAHVEWLAQCANIDGILIDTFNKKAGKDLLDYLDVNAIKRFVRACHERKLEAWIAGSIKASQIAMLWGSGVDVVCVRSAACGSGADRKGKVEASLVRRLVPR